MIAIIAGRCLHHLQNPPIIWSKSVISTSSDIQNHDFDDDFVDDDDAKMVEEAETSVRTRLSSLEKRRLIDNLLEEKRLAKELKDDLDDIDNFDEDGDDWDDDDF